MPNQIILTAELRAGSIVPVLPDWSLELLYSLITVSLAVELWKQPRVKHSAHTILTRLS